MCIYIHKYIYIYIYIYIRAQYLICSYVWEGGMLCALVFEVPSVYELLSAWGHHAVKPTHRKKRRSPNVWGRQCFQTVQLSRLPFFHRLIHGVYTDMHMYVPIHPSIHPSMHPSLHPTIHPLVYTCTYIYCYIVCTYTCICVYVYIYIYIYV